MQNILETIKYSARIHSLLSSGKGSKERKINLVVKEKVSQPASMKLKGTVQDMWML